MVKALLRSIPSLFNLIIVAGLVLVIIAIMGLNLFAGKFYSCSGSAISPVVTKQVSISLEHNELKQFCKDCLNGGGSWNNNPYNFDNFFQSFLIFFMMVTGEAWDKVFYSAVNAVGQNMQPVTWASSWAALPMFGFALATNILILNLFVGVVIDNFREMKEELSEFKDLNQNQKDWVDMQMFMQKKKLKVIKVKPENYLRGYCYDIVNHPYFVPTIIIAIVCNTIILGAYSATIPDQASLAFEILNGIFLIFFHVEAILKLGAWGFNSYFNDNWNM